MEAKRVKERKIRKVKEVMPRSTVVFLLVLIILASVLGYNYFARPFGNYQAAQIEEPDLVSIAEEDIIPELVEKPLTKKELAQLIALPYSLDLKESTQSALLSWISENQPGVVTLFGGKISTSSATLVVDKISYDLDKEQKPLIAVDHEGGTVQRLSGLGFTDLPSWKLICSTSSTQRQDLLTSSAQELSQVGVDVIFAPVIDVASQSAILKDRVCSSDPEVVTKMAAEFINIFAQQKIISVIKHYPGIGSISKDLHNNFDEVDLTEGEVLIFKDLLEAYPLLGVMSAHVGVKDRYEGEPCSLNIDCIDDLTGYFPQTLVFTDALDMISAGYIDTEEELASLAERSVAAIKAGNDVLVFGPNIGLDEISDVLSELEIAYGFDEEFQLQAEKSVKKIRQYKEILRQ